VLSWVREQARDDNAGQALTRRAALAALLCSEAVALSKTAPGIDFRIRLINARNGPEDRPRFGRAQRLLTLCYI
jgi:hypothetical protein